MTLPPDFDVVRGLYRDPRFHNERCDLCQHFPCSKTPPPDQNYCAFQPPKFERKETAP
jgi:hypothetical protein